MSDPQYVINMQTACMDAVGCCNIPSQNCIDMVFGSLIPRPFGLGDLVTCTDIRWTRQRVDAWGGASLMGQLYFLVGGVNSCL